jgi:RNase P subunit RPR2
LSRYHQPISKKWKPTIEDRIINLLEHEGGLSATSISKILDEKQTTIHPRLSMLLKFKKLKKTYCKHCHSGFIYSKC